MSDQSRVGAMLKRYRLAAGLSQEELAGRAAISARAVSDIERGVHSAPRGATLNLLANALGLDARQRALLLGAAHPQTPESAPTVTPTHRARIPAPPGALFGRARELAVASRWAHGAENRMLTLTGPGGVGKTRLALEVAHAHTSLFPDGVIFVDLAPLTDAAQVSGAIAAALGFPDEPEDAPLARLAAYLGDQHTALLLDNAERVTGAAPFLAELLSQCPSLYLLVTSRAPLKLRAERVLPIAPLAPADAQELFVALWSKQGFGGPVSQPDVAAICDQLDCLPLAIELAAAQTAAMPLRLVLQRLTERLGASNGPRDLPDRQRTMEATLDWSYDLLTDEQRRALRALSVFASGWTLEAASAVLATIQFDAIAALMDASLVAMSPLEDTPDRWRLLDLTREYALAKLRAAGEEEAVMRRLATYYAAQADRAKLRGPERRSERGQADLPNARLALEWAERRSQAELGLRLASYGRVLHACGQPREAADWMERMLTLDAAAREDGEDTAPLTARVAGLYSLARVSLTLERTERVESALDEALRLAESIGDHAGLAEVYATRGDLARSAGRNEDAIRAYEESAAHARLAPDGYPRHRALAREADAALLRGKLDQAARALDAALADARERTSAWEVAMILNRMASLASQRRRYGQARALYLESLAVFVDFEESAFAALALEGAAATLAAEGWHASAVRLYAGADAMRQRGASPAAPAERALIEATLDRARAALGEPRYRAEWIAGSAHAPATLAAEAQAAADQRRPASDRRSQRRR